MDNIGQKRTCILPVSENCIIRRENYLQRKRAIPFCVGIALLYRQYAFYWLGIYYLAVNNFFGSVADIVHFLHPFHSFFRFELFCDIGSMCALRSFILCPREKTARPRMLRHFVPSRWLHPLAPLKRISPVDLPSANDFDKPFAASKFEKLNTENQTVDWSHYANS